MANVPTPTDKIPKLDQPSPFFLHYGPHHLHPFKDTNRSGHTPVSPLPSKEPYLSDEAWRTRKYIEILQMWSQRGFSSRELKALETMPIYNTTSPAPTLSNAIHPILELENWETVENMPKHLPPLPIGHGHQGYWVAENPVVWQALQPVLRLASEFISNFHLWPWWDSLINGAVEEIETSNTAPSGGKLYRIRLRDEILVTADDKFKTHMQFAILARQMSWSITTGYGVAWVRNGDKDFRWTGLTEYNEFLAGSIRVNLSLDMIIPLLRTNLTEAERRMQEFQVAETIVHELAHCLWRLRSRDFPMVEVEPYLEDEPVSELGRSLIAHIFGGTPQRLNSYSAPPLAIGLRNYPLVSDWSPPDPLLYITPEMTRPNFYPAPVTYFTSIQQENFWTCYVAVFGGPAFRFRPLTHGRSISDTYEPGWVQHFFNDYPSQIFSVNMNATDDQSIALQYENQRRATATRVQEAFTGTTMMETMEAMRRGVLGTFDTIPEADAATDEDQKEDNWSPPSSKPARFDEIRGFLFLHRQSLALDTMIGRRPMDLVLAYITRTRLIAISPEEWHEFILYCAGQKFLFQYYNAGRGEMEYIRHGWPDLPTPSWVTALPVPDVPEAHQRMMTAHMAKNRVAVYLTHLPDVDKELMLLFFNRDRRANLSLEELDNLLRWCNWKKIHWVIAPEGMARLREEDEAVYKHLPEHF